MHSYKTRKHNDSDAQSSNERTLRVAKPGRTRSPVPQVKPLENMEEKVPGKIKDVPSSEERTLGDNVASSVIVSGIEHICRRDWSLRRQDWPMILIIRTSGHTYIRPGLLDQWIKKHVIMKFKDAWEGWALPRVTKFLSCKVTLIDGKEIKLILIFLSGWSGFIKVGLDLFNFLFFFTCWLFSQPGLVNTLHPYTTVIFAIIIKNCTGSW